MAGDDKAPRASGNKVLLGSFALIVVAVGAAVGLQRAGRNRATVRTSTPVVQWQPAFPKPQHNGLQSVWGSGLNVVSVGRAGAIVTSHDLGITWRVRPSHTSEDLQSVWGDGRGVVVAVGNNGAILRSEDWGDSWAKLSWRFPPHSTQTPDSGLIRQEAGAGTLTELWGDAASGELWASGRFGIVAHSTDRGRTWSAIDTGVPADLYAIWANPARGVVIVAGREGTILKSTDRGAHWTSRMSNVRATLLSIHNDSGNNLTAVGWFGTVISSSDLGDNWVPSQSPTQEDLAMVTGFGQGNAIAVGMRGTALVRRNGTWSALTTNATETLGAFWTDGRVGIAVGTEGAIYRVHDQGARWEAKHGRVLGSLLATTGAGRTRWAVGRTGTILRSIDEGRTWTTRTHESRVDMIAAFAIDERELYLTTADQKILHSTDGGETFVTHNPPEGTRGLGTIWASSATDVYIAGPSGLIMKSTDRGQTWRRLNTGIGEDFFALWGVNANEVFAVGTRGYIVRSTDQGVTWQRMINMSTRDLTNVNGDGRGNMVAVGKEGEVLMSADHGVHWRIARVGLPPTASMFGVCVAGDVWYGAGLGATLIRSTDHGQTWTREHPYSNDDLTSLWCDRNDRPILAGYAGEVLTRSPLE
ncbi:MAG: YCF48-related protein [Polyangiales bacterium]